MNRSRIGFALFVFGLGLSATACASASGEDPASQSDEALDIETSDRVHTMPKFEAKATLPEGADGITPDAAAGARLTYFGGPVIPSVKVFTIYWGSRATSHRAHLDAFYPAITKSAYFDWLKEYNTSKQHIGRGSFGSSIVITPSVTSPNITDVQIQKELAKQMAANKVPKTDGTNNLYMIYFPAGTHITGPGGAGQSCVQFCAYHGTFKQGGKLVYYGVIPDLDHDGCELGCGAGTPNDNVTEVSSHEMIEAVTDGAVGLATTFAAPLAWYDRTNGEIGDICNGTAGHVAGFTVQLEWSNAKNACIAQ
jgi:hypothetical protein